MAAAEDLPEPVAARTASAPAARRAQHCVIFAVDVAGFTDVKRDDEVQLAVRNAMYGVVIDAFNGAHLPWEECLHEDRGDGILVIIPAKMPSATVVDPLFDRVRAGLRRHNRMASDAAVIQLRAAVHIGEVYSDAHGLAGTAVNHLCRLLDAPVFKQALADSGADIGLIVSDYFFESVVRPGPGMIDPDTFHPVTVEVKRTRTHGWIHLPGGAPAPLGGAPAAPAAPPPGAAEARDLYGTGPRNPVPPTAAPAQGFMFFGPTTIHGDVVAGDKIVSAKDVEPPKE
jgi:hypothetical protein